MTFDCPTFSLNGISPEFCRKSALRAEQGDNERRECIACVQGQSDISVQLDPCKSAQYRKKSHSTRARRRGQIKGSSPYSMHYEKDKSCR